MRMSTCYCTDHAYVYVLLHRCVTMMCAVQLSFCSAQTLTLYKGPYIIVIIIIMSYGRTVTVCYFSQYHYCPTIRLFVYHTDRRFSCTITTLTIVY